MTVHRPNILILMVDQLSGALFPDGPAPFLHAPNLRRLSDHSLRFQNCYTASPLRAPARASFLTGQLPRRTRVYDDAAAFASDIPTYAHHLRRDGYQTALSGRMHFAGPDQMLGFEERLTIRIAPADIGETPDEREPGERIDRKTGNPGLIANAGVAEITDQLEYDDEVAFQAVQKLYDLSRGADARPWCLTVSFAHPRAPFVARRKYWDLYEGIAELAPPEAIPHEEQDPHSRRLMDASDGRGGRLSDDQVRRARQGYFANISYIDDRIGEIFAVLEATGQEAIVLFVADHGEMLGERGIWFTPSFFEAAARVPLMISAAGYDPILIADPVSTLDVMPTLAALAGVDMAEITPWTDGVSLLPLATGGTRPMVAVEYAAEESKAPMVALREGAWKFISGPCGPDLLFDLASDPAESRNMADDPRAAEILDYFRQAAAARWDLAAYTAEVSESQARRRIVHEALRSSARFPHGRNQPPRNASAR